MSKKKTTRWPSLKEESNTCDVSAFLTHCDFNSVCFSLDENARFFSELMENKSSAIISSSEKMKCHCKKYETSEVSNNDMIVSCDNILILEKYGSVCTPSMSLFFPQGYPNHYFDIILNSASVSSSSFYLSIYDQIVESNRQKGNLSRTSVLPEIYAWDHPIPSEKQYFRFEHIDYGALFYKEFFVGKEHANFIGSDTTYGPFAISIKREILVERNHLDNYITTFETPLYLQSNSVCSNESTSNFVVYRVIARFVSPYNLRVIFPEYKGLLEFKSKQKFSSYKQIIQTIFPEISPNCMALAPESSKIEEELLKFDVDMALTRLHKVGLLYCGPDQTQEDQIYANKGGSKSYDLFLNFLGSYVTLAGFKGYPGMLDTKSNLNGTHSIYTEFQGREIMFHVATLMPFDHASKQQVTKKRFIGNDMVTLIFLDENSPPFSPEAFISHFQQVFILVRAIKKDSKLVFRLALYRKNDVPYFGPPISESHYSLNDFFRHFILTKSNNFFNQVINAQYACQKVQKFFKLSTRTRYQLLQNLKDQIFAESSIEKVNKIGEIFRSSLNSKLCKAFLNSPIYFRSTAAVIWPCLVIIYIIIKLNMPSQSIWLSCTLCISAFCLSIDTILTVLHRYLVAWRRINPYTAGNSFLIKLTGEGATQLSRVVRRLESVSNIVEAQTIIFEPPSCPDDFVINDFAIVQKTSPYDDNRKKLVVGSQILEIENIPLCTLSLGRFKDILFHGDSKRLLIARPFNFKDNVIYSVPSESWYFLKFISIDKENIYESLPDPESIELDKKPDVDLSKLSSRMCKFTAPKKRVRFSSLRSSLILQKSDFSSVPRDQKNNEPPESDHHHSLLSLTNCTALNRAKSVKVDLTYLNFL